MKQAYGRSEWFVRLLFVEPHGRVILLNIICLQHLKKSTFKKARGGMNPFRWTLTLSEGSTDSFPASFYISLPQCFVNIQNMLKLFVGPKQTPINTEYTFNFVPPVSISGPQCVHPSTRRILGLPLVVTPCHQHDSTGSTVDTFLSQTDLNKEREEFFPCLPSIPENRNESWGDETSARGSNDNTP